MTSDKLKALTDERDELQKEIDLLSAEENLVSRKLSKAKNEFGVVNRRIQAAKVRPKEHIVSDHAMLRYLERIRGMSMDELTEEICPANVRSRIEVLGNGEFPVEHGEKRHWLYVRGGVVTTVTLTSQKEYRKNGKA
jgi:hypothetical protein